MLRYDMLLYVMLRYVMLCYVMLSYVLQVPCIGDCPFTNKIQPFSREHVVSVVR